MTDAANNTYASRHGLALERAAAAGVELLLCADPANVHWLTGVAADVETGPSPFAPGPLVVLAPGEPALLVVSEDERPATVPDGIETVSYEGFTTAPLRGAEHAARLTASALGGRSAAIDGVTARGLVNAARAASDAEPTARATARVVDVADALLDARAVKDDLALAHLRAAIAVADAGQAALRAALTSGSGSGSGTGLAGRSEIELFGALRTAMETAAGARVPLLADLVSGPRTAGMGGPPGSRAIGPGDLVLCDLAPRVNGVWGDSCATVAVGEPTAAIRAAHGKVHDALERAIDAVRPGVAVAELDALTRAGLDYPHHTGHGVGGSYHERPRVVPGASGTLREGMVIALEPGFYADTQAGADRRFGIRLEHVVRVTADGCEDLSRHRLDL
ncbi:MAG TPA: Xaa-Pro peptidase family protein [Conexibacter sp.]|jgi:Xaa-Pro aminopeptidase